MDPIGLNHSPYSILPQIFPLLNVALEFVGMSSALKGYEISDSTFKVNLVGFLEWESEKIGHDNVKSAANVRTTL